MKRIIFSKLKIQIDDESKMAAFYFPGKGPYSFSHVQAKPQLASVKKTISLFTRELTGERKWDRMWRRGGLYLISHVTSPMSCSLVRNLTRDNINIAVMETRYKET